MHRYVFAFLLLVGCSTTDLIQTCGGPDNREPDAATDGGADASVEGGVTDGSTAADGS